MWQSFNSLKLNGISYSKAELHLTSSLKRQDATLPAWEKSMFRFINEWVNKEDYIISHTSGSTGKPKEIIIEKNKMVASAQLTSEYLQLKPEHHALLCLNCENIAGKMMVVRALVTGMNLIAAEPSSLPLKGLLHEKIDFAAFVPMQLFLMMNDDAYKNKIESIANVIIGGSEVSYLLKEKLNTFSNNIYETFGMTETVSHIALKLISKNNSRDYFEVLKGITVSTDNVNRLIIHAPHLQANDIITNDVIEWIDSNSFKWLGRFDNVINSGGVKLIPETIEQQLQPYIHHRFFMAGMPDAILGQQLVMIVESGERLDTAALIETAKLFLEKYKVPKRIIQVPRFAETVNGKINRKETLRQLLNNYLP